MSKIPLEHSDDYRMSVVRNITTNSRLFCALVAALAAWTDYPLIALFAIIPVGLAVVIDSWIAQTPFQLWAWTALNRLSHAMPVAALLVLALLLSV